MSASLPEREACVTDITKLRFQLKVESEKLDKAQEQLSQAEELHQHLHEDISLAKNLIPVVREDLDHQRGLMDQINTEQNEVTRPLIPLF